MSLQVYNVEIVFRGYNRPKVPHFSFYHQIITIKLYCVSILVVYNHPAEKYVQAMQLYTNNLLSLRGLSPTHAADFSSLCTFSTLTTSLNKIRKHKKNQMDIFNAQTVKKQKKNGKSKITFLDYKTYRFDKNLADGRSFFDWFVNIHRIR